MARQFVQDDMTQSECQLFKRDQKRSLSKGALEAAFQRREHSRERKRQV
jgi:hypothetical protein